MLVYLTGCVPRQVTRQAHGLQHARDVGLALCSFHLGEHLFGSGHFAREARIGFLGPGELGRLRKGDVGMRSVLCVAPDTASDIQHHCRQQDGPDTDEGLPGAIVATGPLRRADRQQASSRM